MNRTTLIFCITILSCCTLRALGLGNDPYDFSSSHFCSACFTNDQDRNYHCCFYFFKCCAEARRGAKSSSTLGPKYPPIPTKIAYIIQQDKGDQSCPFNCRGHAIPPALCCLTWNAPEKPEEANPSVSYFRATQEFEGYVEADSMVKNSTDEEEDETLTSSWPTSQNYQDTDEPFRLALGANVNPSKVHSSYFDFNKKLFIPPSLASGHEMYDLASSREGGEAKKVGWITKDLLKSDEDGGK